MLYAFLILLLVCAVVAYAVSAGLAALGLLCGTIVLLVGQDRGWFNREGRPR